MTERKQGRVEGGRGKAVGNKRKGGRAIEGDTEAKDFISKNNFKISS